MQVFFYVAVGGFLYLVEKLLYGWINISINK